MPPQVIATIAKIVLPMLVPLILNKLVGGKLRSMGAGTAGTTTISPGGVPITTPGTPGNKAAGLAGGALGGASNAITTALPHIGNLVGKGIQAAGTAGGALAQAAGDTAGMAGNALLNVPGAIARIGTSDQQRAVYGDTVMDAAGKVFGDLGDVVQTAGSGLGTVGNTAITGLTGAVGTSVQDISNLARLANLDNEILKNLTTQGEAIKALGLSPSQAGILMRLISNRSRLP